ncbi:MAG: bifunctional DNA-formamidopyrimidine glycosylase/DNA-(apurinic or apyrimidinic site) lyase [Candidatus Bipolaricaulota bacterium]|nr:bifunctional DNA-formamidopyrimidine glycosylase/DNA-(apurinic or apyrimidinic site) lyase [Candidatus Bipolaricaulota bacterium]MDW8126660.1 bifunctional DNA-formamidopyrimidine glycosylase/DNA-(apurinic or apyrimidinic site) lyase [Candidatus Bipolaricaulota bacterium]
MPELPEVETTVRILRPKVLGMNLLALQALDPALAPVAKLLPLPQPVQGLTRRGKYILFQLSEKLLVVHLRMSGRLAWHEKEPIPDHTRLILAFPHGAVLFIDPRRLGTVEVQDGFSEELGPDALGDLSFLEEALKESRAPIKVWLLDQRNIAGLGNIYAAEALFLAGIDPRRRASSLSPQEVSKLKAAIHQVLHEALAAMGTTLFDKTYRTPVGEAGDYEPRVYGREGLPCKVCGTPIERIELGGRGTYFCPHCQK